MPRKLWEHPDPQSTRMAEFMRKANQKHGLNMKTFNDLYEWSTGDLRTDFWQDIWDDVQIIHEGSYSQVVDTKARMDSIPKWFKGVHVNFAENALYFRDPSSPSRVTTKGGKEDAKVATTEVREGCKEIRDCTWKELRERVGRLSNAMRAHGVRKGDRVAVVASNSIDTLVVFLAVTTLGGSFSSSSTDMGTKGVLDRLLQITPKWIFMDDFSVYNGKTVDLRPKMTEIVNGMKDVQDYKGMISMPRWQQDPKDVSSVPNTVTLEKYLEAARGDTKLRFERVAFADPFLIAYSSGTTGTPKCIVHSVGGVLISAMKEGKLHRDTKPTDVALQYTTTGWIMYLTSVMSLLFGARPVLYDGSPFQPDLKTFVKLWGDQKVTRLGISPRYMTELQKHNISPREVTDLSAMHSVTSTGMVLADAQFNWFYDTAFPACVQLCNISGGTDLAGCFGMENPLTPVYVGGCQGPSLGTPIAVYDQQVEGGPGVKGKALPEGEAGEIVATKSFPNMPVFFWGDEAGKKYW
ncbi:hypothetical protein LTS18_004892, partial [Coniosporium uncinatum]